MRREVRATANRLANFDDANLRRSARAAVAAAARVKRALELLGDDVPEHLLAAGKLRVEHTQASLEELGQLADPPMTKDAIAGRIRRLLQTADKRAADLGVPDTESAVTPDLF
jgi:DNA-binding protein WhiA